MLYLFENNKEVQDAVADWRGVKPFKKDEHTFTSKAIYCGYETTDDDKIKMYLVNASQGPGLLNSRVMTEYMIKPSVSRYKLDDLPKGTLININHHSNDFINIIPNIPDIDLFNIQEFKFIGSLDVIENCEKCLRRVSIDDNLLKFVKKNMVPEDKENELWVPKIHEFIKKSLNRYRDYDGYYFWDFILSAVVDTKIVLDYKVFDVEFTPYLNRFGIELLSKLTLVTACCFGFPEFYKPDVEFIDLRVPCLLIFGYSVHFIDMIIDNVIRIKNSIKDIKEHVKLKDNNRIYYKYMLDNMCVDESILQNIYSILDKLVLK